MTDAPTPPFSGLYTTCPKCTRKTNHVAQYDRQLNLMGRHCTTCKYSWHELCADVSNVKEDANKARQTRTFADSSPLLDFFKDVVTTEDLLKFVDAFKKGMK